MRSPPGKRAPLNIIDSPSPPPSLMMNAVLAMPQSIDEWPLSERMTHATLSQETTPLYRITTLHPCVLTRQRVRSLVVILLRAGVLVPSTRDMPLLVTTILPSRLTIRASGHRLKVMTKVRTSLPDLSVDTSATLLKMYCDPIVRTPPPRLTTPVVIILPPERLVQASLAGKTMRAANVADIPSELSR